MLLKLWKMLLLNLTEKEILTEVEIKIMYLNLCKLTYKQLTFLFQSVLTVNSKLTYIMSIVLGL